MNLFENIWKLWNCLHLQITHYLKFCLLTSSKVTEYSNVKLPFLFSASLWLWSCQRYLKQFDHLFFLEWHPMRPHLLQNDFFVPGFKCGSGIIYCKNVITLNDLCLSPCLSCISLFAALGTLLLQQGQHLSSPCNVFAFLLPKAPSSAEQ